MTDEEYKKELEIIEANYSSLKRILAVKYANENNPYKIGDILKDHHQIVKVEKIGYSYIYNSNGKLQCVYKGVILKSDLTPAKKQDNPEMFQSNVREKLN